MIIVLEDRLCAGFDQLDWEAKKKVWIAALDEADLKFILIALAAVVLGGVVLPRLAGWIFHPTNRSFLYIFFVVLGAIGIWQFNNIKELVEENKFYAIVGAVGIAIIIAMAGIAKDKTKDKGKEL